MNALVLEDGGDAILIDCGIMFPEEEVGIDVMHADFSYAVELGPRLRAVVLTHGHEDHIGAIPFLLRRIRVPVYGPAFALELVRARLTEHSLGFVPDLRVIRPREPFFAGSLEIEPIRVTHSIPDAVALAIRTSIGTVIHTGDFKVDLNPPDGRHFDLQRLSEYGAAGVTRSVGLDERRQEDHARRARGGRRLTGRSRRAGQAGCSWPPSRRTCSVCRPRSSARAARAGGGARGPVDLAPRRGGDRPGMFRLPAERLVAPERAGDLPRERVLVLLSGTQGEPRSGLARLSLGEHRHLRVEPGDLVILTSRHIPGNEIAIARMIDNLARLGARVVHSGNRPGIHASGHAHREEQKLMIQLVRPRFFIPVHGTYQYLFDHARLAGEMGISATMLIEDGQVAIVDEDGMSRGESVAVERIHRDGLAGVNPEVLRQRRARGRWPVNVFVVLDHDLRLGRPVMCCGVVPEDDLEVGLPAASRGLRGVITAAPEGVRSQPDELRERCRRATRRFFDEAVGRRPIVLVNLTVLTASPHVSSTMPCNPPQKSATPPEEPNVDVGDGGRD